MKIKLFNYEDASNGVSLQLLPETDIEFEMLRMFWKHGWLNTGHPSGGFGHTGYYIQALGEPSRPVSEDSER